MKLILFALTAVSVWGQANLRTTDGSNNFPVKPLRSTPSIAWEIRPGFRDFGGMAVSNGVVVSGNVTDVGGAFGYDAATGKRLWSVPGQMQGQPAVDGKAAYVVNRTETGMRLSSVALKTGRTLWSIDGEHLGNDDGEALVADDRVYMINQNGRVDALATATGKTLWELVISNEKTACATAAALVNGILYFGGGQVGGARDSLGISLWAVSADTGKVLWRYRAMPEGSGSNGACVSAPAVSGGVVVISSNSLLVALDAQTGKQLWLQKAFIMSGGYPKYMDFSDPVIVGDVVYAYSKSQLNGFDLRTGANVFQFTAIFESGNRGKRLAAAEGVLFFLAELPNQPANAARFPLVALDLRTRQVLWTHAVTRDKPGVPPSSWLTDHFLLDDGAIYYENQSILVRLR